MPTTNAPSSLPTIVPTPWPSPSPSLSLVPTTPQLSEPVRRSERRNAWGAGLVSLTEWAEGEDVFPEFAGVLHSVENRAVTRTSVFAGNEFVPEYKLRHLVQLNFVMLGQG